MAARSVVDSWSVHHGLYAAIEPRVALQFSYDANRHKIAKQLLKIRNESGTEHITYKIKTTGPVKFKVHPCTGVIANGGAEAKVEIQPNLAMFPDVALLNKERFLVCTMPISEIPSTQEELLSLWSDNEAVADADTHIIAVAINPLNSESEDACLSPRDQTEAVLRDTFLHDADRVDPRQAQLQRDKELLGNGGAYKPGMQGACSNRSSPLPSSAEFVEDASNPNFGSGGANSYAYDPSVTAVGESYYTPSYRPVSRQYEEDGAARDNAAACRCDDDGNVMRAPVYAECNDPSMSFSRSLCAMLIVVLSVLAWWGFNAVTPEPETTIEWLFRKIGIRYMIYDI